MRSNQAAVEPQKNRLPRPKGFEFDVTAAENLERTRQCMPPRLWAAWIGRRAGIQVNLVCTNAGGDFVGFGTEPGENGLQRCSYLRPSQIAAKIHNLIGTSGEIWKQAHLDNMIQWLDTQDQRNFCFESIGMLAHDDEHDPPGRAVIQNVIKQIAVKQTMMDIESPKGREYQERVKASPVLTEPAEIFEAIKPPIIYADPTAAKGSLDEFFNDNEPAMAVR